MKNPNALEIAKYIIDSPFTMYEDGYYYAHWNPEKGLNYDGNSNSDNIMVCVPCLYADDMESIDELTEKEDIDDMDFMSICESISQKLYEEIVE